MQTPETNTRSLTREQFEIRLDHIEMEYLRAMKSARTLQTINATAREKAMQRSMNIMVDDLIVQLEMETNVTVEVIREEKIGDVPCPPRMIRKQTMLNFDNKR